jgi:hypothetical protein
MTPFEATNHGVAPPVLPHGPPLRHLATVCVRAPAEPALAVTRGAPAARGKIGGRTLFAVTRCLVGGQRSQVCRRRFGTRNGLVSNGHGQCQAPSPTGPADSRRRAVAVAVAPHLPLERAVSAPAVSGARHRYETRSPPASILDPLGAGGTSTREANRHLARNPHHGSKRRLERLDTGAGRARRGKKPRVSTRLGSRGRACRAEPGSFRVRGSSARSPRWRRGTSCRPRRRRSLRS